MVHSHALILDFRGHPLIGTPRVSIKQLNLIKSTTHRGVDVDETQNGRRFARRETALCVLSPWTVDQLRRRIESSLTLELNEGLNDGARSRGIFRG
jgi:hypothetical protein